MRTFRNFFSEQELENGEKALLDSGEETKSMEAIRTGNHLRSDKGSFWEDFINLLGSLDAIAELLEVPRDKVAGWPSKIKQIIEKVHRADNQDRSDKNTVVKTGNEPLNDPNGMDGGSDTPETRPSP